MTPHRTEPERAPLDRLVLVVGTGTDIGKTWVTVRLVEALRSLGAEVWARKPVQSFAGNDDPAKTDAALLGYATGEPAEVVCPPHRWYPAAMAPPMAAEYLGRPPFTVDDLVNELRWPAAGPASAVVPAGRSPGRGNPGVSRIGLVETAGGSRSPLATDGDSGGLALALGPSLVVLVAEAGLGTIHAVRAGAAGFERSDVPPALVVVLNRFDAADPLHRRNHQWLAERDGYEVFVTPGGEPELARRVLA